MQPEAAGEPRAGRKHGRLNLASRLNRSREERGKEEKRKRTQRERRRGVHKNKEHNEKAWRKRQVFTGIRS